MLLFLVIYYYQSFLRYQTRHTLAFLIVITFQYYTIITETPTSDPTLQAFEGYVNYEIYMEMYIDSDYNQLISSAIVSVIIFQLLHHPSI